MNFFFETAVNALEAFLILEFLAQYFGFRNQTSIRYHCVRSTIPLQSKC